MQPPLSLNPGDLVLSLGTYKSQMGLINDLIVQAAFESPGWVLDGGNRVAPYHFARLIRQKTPAIYPILNRIQIARAFTCFQVVTLLTQTQYPEGIVFILDVLTTFEDEVIPTHQRNFLLRQVLTNINRLRSTAAVFMTIGRSETLELLPTEMLDQLKSQASRVFAPLVPVQSDTLRLF
jgi:hypothetical protein